MTDTSRRWINRVLRWSLGVVFVVAALGVPGTKLGFGKIYHPSSFANNIRTYEMVPEPLVFPLAIYLPWLELTTGLVLLAGVWKREGLFVAMTLCVVLLVANMTVLIRGLEIICGCFGEGYHGSAIRESLISGAMLTATVVASVMLGPPTHRRDGGDQTAADSGAAA